MLFWVEVRLTAFSSVGGDHYLSVIIGEPYKVT
jgi:hypothetical protein